MMGERFYVEGDGLTITDKADEYCYLIADSDDALKLCDLLNCLNNKAEKKRANETGEIRWIRAEDYLTRIKQGE